MVEIGQTIDVISKTLNIGLVYFSCCLLLFLIIVYALKKKKASSIYSKAILCSYLFFILASTVLSRPVNDAARYNMTLFWTYREVLKSPRGSNGLNIELFLNIIMLIPVGFIIPKSFKKRLTFSLTVGFIISVSIESLQYLMRRGLCEIDDVINNIIGVGIGYGLYQCYRKLLFQLHK